MMLEPDPKLRATASALLALPMLRRPRPWSVLWYVAADALSRGWALWQALLSLLCWLWHGLAHPASWLQPPSPPATPPGSPPCSLLLHSSLSSSWDDDSVGWVRAVGAGGGRRGGHHVQVPDPRGLVVSRTLPTNLAPVMPWDGNRGQWGAAWP